MDKTWYLDSFNGILNPISAVRTMCDSIRTNARRDGMGAIEDSGRKLYELCNDMEHQIRATINLMNFSKDHGITSSTVYSDSFDEMIQKNFTYKGKSYTWNDSDCVYYNDNGDEDDYFMEIPEGAITSSKTIKSSGEPQYLDDCFNSGGAAYCRGESYDSCMYTDELKLQYWQKGWKWAENKIDVNKIYTTENADKLRRGSIVIAASSLNSLIQRIDEYDRGITKTVDTLISVAPSRTSDRFFCENSYNYSNYYSIVYLISDVDKLGNSISNSRITSTSIKSSADPIDELERRAHYALPYDNEITILNRVDKLVIKVALKDDIKRIRGEQAANVIFAKLQGDNKFMQMLDNLVHNDKEVVCIVYDPDFNERIASINF